MLQNGLQRFANCLCPGGNMNRVMNEEAHLSELAGMTKKAKHGEEKAHSLALDQCGSNQCTVMAQPLLMV